MKRIRTIVIVFIILIAQNAIAEGVFESAPGWLKGVLSIDLFGSDSLEESWPLDRYVCVFDFDASRIDKVKIPSGAAYTKEWQSGGLPIIIYPSEYGYYYFDSYSSWKWREVHYLEIVRTQNEDGIRYTYGEMLMDIWTGEMPERASDDNNVYYGTCSFDSPMRVLGMNSEYNSEILRDRLSVFYLQYGVSSKGEMEIQLVREDGVGLLDERKEIIHSFPLDYDFGAWQYSISNGGRITWVEGRGTLVCADEYGTKTFTTSGRILGFPAWYDDSTILYLDRLDEELAAQPGFRKPPVKKVTIRRSLNYFKGKMVAQMITKDTFGYTIMERWFNGLGKKLVIADNPKWNQFLLDNENFVSRIIKHARTAIFNGTYKFDVQNEWLSLDLSDHGEGDYRTGYGLINGTNSDYGGFCVSGTVQYIEDNRYHVVATYELNDYVDPGNYVGDWIYAVGSWAVLGACINYELQISGTVEFDFYYG